MCHSVRLQRNHPTVSNQDMCRGHLRLAPREPKTSIMAHDLAALANLARGASSAHAHIVGSAHAMEAVAKLGDQHEFIPCHARVLRGEKVLIQR